MEVPISTTLENKNNGTIHYIHSLPKATDIAGIFSFTFYFPYHDETIYDVEMEIVRNPYLNGLSLYTQLCQKEDSVFKGWKVLIYTDAFTFREIQKIEKEYSDTLLIHTEKPLNLTNNEVIEFAIVDWPYYNSYMDASIQGHVNGDILRCMRFRAFFDFPTIPVFVRDADTLFTTAWVRGMFTFIDVQITKEELYEWEANFLKGALALPNTFIFGTSLFYKKPWHNNKYTERYSPFGAFAGFQSVIPNVPCFQNLTLWDESMEYLLQHSKRLNTSSKNKLNFLTADYSNKSNPQKVGKDEQLLLYVFLPTCRESIYFFELDYTISRTHISKGKTRSKPDYPTIIFERGSNTTIQKYFNEAIASKFAISMNKQIEEAQSKNRNDKQIFQDSQPKKKTRTGLFSKMAALAAPGAGASGGTRRKKRKSNKTRKH